ncbi:hypothetical protein E2542_SST09109 [Spatholobus suberectus]|nr:hypothetical protein E2542_SST09109 [Spatholobus suberectus]
MSWIEENLRRRFLGCGLYEAKKRKGCQFFKWHDPQLNACEKKIIRALMKIVEEMKPKDNELKKSVNDMKIIHKLL